MIFILLASCGLHAQNGEYIAKVFESESGSLNYNIMYPHDFDEHEKYPLMLFLHGAGERGSDNKAQLIHGSKLFRDSLAKYPAIVIFPQCTKDDYWVDLKSEGKGQGRSMEVMTGEPNPNMERVISLVDRMLEEKYVDPSRFYVAGLSMGGMGTMELAWRMPEKITAAIAICGVGPREKAATMKPVPFWFFHGVDDIVVPSRYSVQMLRAMQVSGGKAKITLYENTGHNSWDQAFVDPDFLPFLFSKSKS
ncbi:carboxylesterase family protein [Portibacter lacus]|nr:PHB depolymerase family esterase [Portibacter lacus]